MGRLVRDDRKATVTQITTHYNQGMQNTISECTTRRTLKQMQQKTTPVLLLSAKNRKQRLQFTQTYQNWTMKICIMDVQPTNLQQLRDAIMSIWTKISEECFQNLVESMPRRIKAVLKAKVGPTRY